MKSPVLSWREYSFDLGLRPYIMGVVNVTPDSFSDGGDFFDPGRAVEHGLQLVEEGADFLDVGGESTRPGAAEVSEEQELARVVPVIRELARQTRIPISVDTYKSAVAEAALDAGAAVVNDISAGLFDPRLVEVTAEARVPLILMHIKGRPRNMQKNPVYDDLMGETEIFSGRCGP